MSVQMHKIEASKRQLRRRLAALPFAEKLRILEELRDRDTSLKANPLRQKTSRLNLSVDKTESEPDSSLTRGEAGRLRRA